MAVTTGLRDPRDKVALVTGASSGIGAELARQLAARGARVALVARRRERLESVAAEIEKAGGRASVHACDVARRPAVAEAARDACAAWGGVDVLVNAAGVARHVLFEDHDVEDIEALLRTNLNGTIYWIKELLPRLRERGRGWIVNVSSFAGKVAQPDEAAYSASKYAITGLSRALSMELAPRGIHVLCVHPALVRTEMFTPEVMARMPRTRPRFMEAPDFARRVLRALERGETEVTLPRRYGWVAMLAEMLPGAIYRGVAKAKLGGLPDGEGGGRS